MSLLSCSLIILKQQIYVCLVLSPMASFSINNLKYGSFFSCTSCSSTENLLFISDDWVLFMDELDVIYLKYRPSLYMCFHLS